MDEGSSDNMDEVGIPMLISRYIKVTMRPEKRGL